MGPCRYPSLGKVTYFSLFLVFFSLQVFPFCILKVLSWDWEDYHSGCLRRLQTRGVDFLPKINSRQKHLGGFALEKCLVSCLSLSLSLSLSLTQSVTPHHLLSDSLSPSITRAVSHSVSLSQNISLSLSLHPSLTLPLSHRHTL